VWWDGVVTHPSDPDGPDYAINMIIFIAVLTMALGIALLASPGARGV
jgi:hypothetical protein